MSIIDRNLYTLSCGKCQITESQAVCDHGSNWSGSHWDRGAEFSDFDVKWQGGGTNEPEIVSAKCKRCGAVPEIDSHYKM